MHNVTFDVSLIFALWFSIALVRGIFFDSRGNWIAWWKRPVMLVSMWILSALLLGICAFCMKGIEYADGLNYNPLVFILCLATFMGCGLSLMAIFCLSVAVPFQNDMELADI